MTARRRRRTSSRRKRARKPRKKRTSGLRHGIARLWTVCVRAAPIWTLVLLVGGATWCGMWYVGHAPAFRVHRVVEPALLAWENPIRIIGQPLLHVDIDSVVAGLRRANPFAKTIRVTREWPDTIRIDAIPRVPVAQIHQRSYLPIDAEGYVFSSSTSAPHPDLPIIDGLSITEDHVESGRINKGARIQLALALLEELRLSPILRREDITLVDVADTQQVTFRLRQGIEVRIGRAQQLTQALDKLAPVLIKLREENLVPRYIDLRFADPVIGAK